MYLESGAGSCGGWCCGVAVCSGNCCEFFLFFGWQFDRWLVGWLLQIVGGCECIFFFFNCPHSVVVERGRLSPWTVVKCNFLLFFLWQFEFWWVNANCWGLLENLNCVANIRFGGISPNRYNP